MLGIKPDNINVPFSNVDFMLDESLASQYVFTNHSGEHCFAMIDTETGEGLAEFMASGHKRLFLTIPDEKTNNTLN